MTTALTYFAFDGSRGLECRLALALAGVTFDDIRLTREEWAAAKPTTPFGGLPMLTVNGRVLAHSNAILAYVGRTHGLHPTDAWAAAEHDAIMASVEDLRGKMPDPRTVGAEGVQAAREAFVAGWLAQWAATVSGRIAGPFLEGNTPNVADIKLYVILRSLLGGTYDHVPPSCLDPWPKFAALQTAVDALPAVRGWFAGKHGS